jgi:uncharacterized damage-inducible protein DinB
MPVDLRESILGAWRTNNRVTMELIERLPGSLWLELVPGVPRKTIQAIAAHIHNSRCSWVRTLGQEHGVPTPEKIDARRATPRQVIAALKRSSGGMEALIDLGFEHDGELPPSKGYVWRNLALDIGHVLTYFVTHEGHHRGQIVMIARQSGQRLPAETTGKLWWWRPIPPARKR